MTAVPLAALVECDDEEISSVELVKDRSGTAPIKDVIAKRPRQSFQDRRTHEQIALVGRQPVENLRRQVVQNVPIVTVYRNCRRLG